LHHWCIRATATADPPRVCWKEIPRTQFTISGIYALDRSYAKISALFVYINVPAMSIRWRQCSGRADPRKAKQYQQVKTMGGSSEN
jgi:hypothetical protein